MGKYGKSSINQQIIELLRLGGDPCTVLAVRDAIIEAERTFDSNLPYLLKNTVDKIKYMRESAPHQKDENAMDVS